MRLLADTNIDFMKYRKFWISISFVLIAVFFFAVFFIHFNLGIDFAGGTQLTLRFRDRPQVDQLRSLLAAAGLGDPEIQRFDKEAANEVIIKTAVTKGSEEGSRERVVAALNRRFNQGETGKIDLNTAGADDLIQLLGGTVSPALAAPAATDTGAASAQAAIADALLKERRKDGLFRDWDAVARTAGLPKGALETLRAKAFLGDYAVLGVENVGPQIGKELSRQGFWAVALSLLGMLGYIALRFELRFGIGAVMASIHDVLVTLGLFILMRFEFNLTTIAAFLTLIGYSTNDTVVIFDRVRENMRKNRRKPLIEVMNESINQTLSRTIMTGGLTMLTVAALLFLGGDVLRGFAFVMTIGIIVGTYSSVYVASPFALLWEQMFGTKSRIRGEVTGTQPAGARGAAAAAGSGAAAGRTAAAGGGGKTAAAGGGGKAAAASPRPQATPQGSEPAAGSKPRQPRAAAGRRRSGRR
ncbi:MAG: protein translocase subunit SecF [Acidobacteria bacterium]|nr:protein translocase subunit SecF [Acidobacteriota bacterium]